MEFGFSKPFRKSKKIKSQKMKILLIIPTLKHGGAERVMSELANNLNTLGHQVHLCLLVDNEDFYTIEKGVTIHRLGFENKNSIQKKFSEIKTFFRLRRLMTKINPDATLSFMDKYNVLTILASRFLKLKVFVSDRSNPNKTISSNLKLLKRQTYKHASGIIAQTSLAKEVLFETTKNSNIRVIHNPLKQIKPLPSIQKEKIILNAGRMVEEKGQKYLIEAFSKLKANDWKLVILGDGKLRPELEKQISKLNLTHKVLLPGTVQDIDEWMARSSIFAFPSISEGFPNALAEAMAFGLPCVSFNCDAGPSDLINNNKNGYLIGTKDVAALASKLNELCSNEELRTKLGNEAKKISTKLDAQKITQEYLAFFKQQKT